MNTSTMAIIRDKQIVSDVQDIFKNNNRQYKLTELNVDTDDDVIEFISGNYINHDLVMNLIYGLKSMSLDEYGNVTFWFAISVANEADYQFPIQLLRNAQYHPSVIQMFNVYTNVAINSAIINGFDFLDIFETGYVEFEKMIELSEPNSIAEQIFWDEFTAWQLS